MPCWFTDLTYLDSCIINYSHNIIYAWTFNFNRLSMYMSEYIAILMGGQMSLLYLGTTGSRYIRVVPYYNGFLLDIAIIVYIMTM